MISLSQSVDLATNRHFQDRVAACFGRICVDVVLASSDTKFPKYSVFAVPAKNNFIDNVWVLTYKGKEGCFVVTTLDAEFTDAGDPVYYYAVTDVSTDKVYSLMEFIVYLTDRGYY